MNISINLMGGLGNQLFQIFALLSYAFRTNQKITIPYSEKLLIGTHRNTYWSNFLKNLNPYIVHNDLHHYTEYSEPCFEYTSLPLFENNTKLKGYFQSYKYFENEYQEIIKIIKLDDYRQKIKLKYNQLIENSISLHFRIGDYKKFNNFHILSYDYYEKAIEQIYNGQKSILYFCQQEDNIDEMISLLKRRFHTIDFIKISDSIPDWEQLLIMSCCQDNIIANSTFSWWAAYFNDYQLKQICYPDKWFTTNESLIDLIPNGWFKIQY